MKSSSLVGISIQMKIVLCLILFAISSHLASAQDSLFLEDFSGLSEEEPWEPTGQPWSNAVGENWSLKKNSEGMMELTSKAQNAEGQPGSGYVFLSLDTGERLPSKILMDLQVFEAALLPPSNVPTVLFTFSLDAPRGQIPQVLATIRIAPARSETGGFSPDRFKVELLGVPPGPGEKEPQLDLPSEVAADQPLRLEIEIAREPDRIRVRSADSEWSDWLPLARHWDDARFLRLYHYGMSIALRRIEFLE
jgi:hypothetical protein